MKKIFLYCVSAIVVLTAAGYVALKTFDPNDYKAEIIETVRTATGRVLTIDGTMKLKVSFTPTISVSDVSLSNPSWAASEKMVRVGNLELRAALLPLLQKKLKIERFILQDAQIDLEKGKDGRNNWTFEKTASGALAKPVEEDAPAGAKKESAVAEWLGNIDVGSVVFENTTLTYADAAGNKKYKIDLSSLILEEQDGGLVLSVKTNVQGEPVTAFGTFNSLSVLSDGTKPFSGNLTVSAAGTEAVLNGSYVKKTGSVSGEIRIKGNNAEKMAKIAGYTIPGFQDFELSASVSGTPELLKAPTFYASLGRADTLLAKVSGRVETLKPLNGLSAQISIAAPNVAAVKGLENLTLAPLYFSANAAVSGNRYALGDISVKASQSDLSGSMSFEKADAPNIVVNLSSGLLNLADLIRERQEQIVSAQTLEAQPAPAKPAPAQPAPQPAAGNKPAKRPSETVFSAEPLPFDMLKKANASIRLNISKLIAADETDLGAVSLSALLKDGVFSLPDFKISNVFALSAKMDASSGKTAQANANLQIKNFPLALFWAKRGIREGNVSADIRLNGNGASSKEIASSVNGKILFSANGVVFNNVWQDWLASFLPVGKSEKNADLTAQCIVVNTPVHNGVLTSNGQIAFEALPLMGQLNLDADLGTEKLAGELLVSSSKPNVWSALSGPVKVGGTLARPSLTMSAQKIVNNAVSYGLAFLMGGREAAGKTAAIKLDNPCKTALEGGIKPAEKKAAEAAPVSANPQADRMSRQLDTLLEKIFQK